MKNENKCFFSISLENGITLTGNNPEEVRTFLHEMHSAFYQLGDHYANNGLKIMMREAFETMKQISNAIDTINQNYQSKLSIKTILNNKLRKDKTMKFKEIRAVYNDGLFDSFKETTLEYVINYLKEEDNIKYVEFLQLFIN